MKYLWFTILYLTVNEVPSMESKLENQKEIDTQALLETMNKMQLRLDFLEKSFQDKSKSMETAIEQLSKFHNITPVIAYSIISPEESSNQRIDCDEKCDKDVSCTSVFWSNSSDPECRFVKNKSTLVEFTPGEIYYCKFCETTIDLVLEAEYSGVIKLVNLALNKSTEASSYANEKTNSSKAIDGDLNTWFSSEALLTKGEPWLMVDLGQRYMVAQLKIRVRAKPIYKGRGGYFQACLVDTFDRNVNPCNKDTEVLKVNKRLRNYHEPLEVNRVIMGRYLVLKKLKEEILEIVELEVQVVIEVTSYYCDNCNARVNTICDDSKIPPECRCLDKFLPIKGDAMKGCEDPCFRFSVDNAICSPISSGKRNCTCNKGFYAVNGDACIYDCKDPCKNFKNRNTICLPVDSSNYNCQCKDGYFEIFIDDPCFGCRNPCSGFRARESKCTSVDSENYNCECNNGHTPMYANDSCFGCKLDICPSHPGYKHYGKLGCLKYHADSNKWQLARDRCKSEGGDLYTPGFSLPDMPEEMSKNNYWIGVKRDGSNPFKRVIDQSELPNESPLWLSGQPDGKPGECVFHESSSGYLRDTTCTQSLAFICQIY